MSTVAKVVIPVVSIWCVALVAYNAHASDATRLLLEIASPFFLAAAFLAIVPIIRAENGRRRIPLRAFVPLASVVLLPVASFFTIGPIHNALFEWSFPTYEALIHRIETNGIVVSTNAVQIPWEQAAARLCENVRAERTSNILVVEFDTDAQGFPAHSVGYIYSYGDSIPSASFAGQRIAGPIQPHWYYFVY